MKRVDVPPATDIYGEIICSLCERLLQDAGGAMLPGRAFERPSEELTARISISIFRSKIVAAAETIALLYELPDEFIQTHCQDALEGMERLVGG